MPASLESVALGAAFLASLALPLKTTACGNTACITVTSAQLMGGMCPDPTVALGRFASGCGFSAVTSVDGDGTLGEGLCCYPVSMNGGKDQGDPTCFGVGGAGGGDFSESASAGIGGSSSSGLGGLGGQGGMGGAGGSGGAGGDDGGNPCRPTATCSSALNGSAPFDQVCGQPADTLNALRVCACTMSCATECEPSLCVGNAPDNGCLACLEGGCAEALSACQSN